MRLPLYSTMNAPFLIGWVAKSPSPLRARPTRIDLRDGLRVALCAMTFGAGLPTLGRLVCACAHDVDPRFDRNRIAQRGDAGASGEREPLDLAELFGRRIALHADL